MKYVSKDKTYQTPKCLFPFIQKEDTMNARRQKTTWRWRSTIIIKKCTGKHFEATSKHNDKDLSTEMKIPFQFMAEIFLLHHCLKSYLYFVTPSRLSTFNLHVWGQKWAIIGALITWPESPNMSFFRLNFTQGLLACCLLLSSDFCPV